MSNLSIKSTLLCVFACAASGALGQPDQKSGGISGAVRAILDEVTELDQISPEEAKKISKDYDLGQDALELAFKRGQTTQLANRARGLASKLIGFLEVSTTRLNGADRDNYLKKQRDQVLSEVIFNACAGPGTIDERKVKAIDLTMDGVDDFIIDESGITCRSISRSMNCGAQVCTSHVFVFEGEYYVKKLETLGIVGQIIQGVPPGIEIFRHGGAIDRVIWTGSTFK